MRDGCGLHTDLHQHYRQDVRTLLVVLLVLIGLLAAATAVTYFVVPIHSLPSFIPGHLVHGNGHHVKRGILAAVIAVILWVAAAAVGVTGRRAH
jgi:hypothetical protein